MDVAHPATQLYAKQFIPLESDPPVLNDLMYGLGVSGCLALTDVWSIDDPVQLSSISRPVYALILVLPTCEEYERHRRSSRGLGDIAGDSLGEEVFPISSVLHRHRTCCIIGSSCDPHHFGTFMTRCDSTTNKGWWPCWVRNVNTYLRLRKQRRDLVLRHLSRGRASWHTSWSLRVVLRMPWLTNGVEYEIVLEVRNSWQAKCSP